MSDVAAMTMAEFVAWVQRHLRAAGIDTVLSGGSCVTVWSANAYRSDDIDLIPDGFGQRARIREVMLGLGFSERNRYFVHADAALWVEFPAGPLAVGEERPQHIAERRTRTGTMRLLSATDCVKDRLAWWFHHQDRQCLNRPSPWPGRPVSTATSWRVGRRGSTARRSSRPLPGGWCAGGARGRSAEDGLRPAWRAGAPVGLR
jgi:hypothetical protein